MVASVTPNNPLAPVGALTCVQCKELLSQYVDGALSAEQSTEVKGHVRNCENCAGELRMLQAEEDMLVEALSGIKPSASHRGRVARMCEDVHSRVETVANSLPDRGWAIFRWGTAIAAFAGFIFGQMYWGIPTHHPFITDLAESGGEIPNLYRVNAIMFFVALFFLVQGHRIAQIKYWISGRWGSPSEKQDSIRAMVLGPSRLEIFMLHGVGLIGVLATLVFHFTYILF